MSILNFLPSPFVLNNHNHVCHPQWDYTSSLCPIVVDTLMTSIFTTTSNFGSESALPVGADTMCSQPISVSSLCILMKLFSNITQMIQVTLGEPIMKLHLSASPPPYLSAMITTIFIILVPSQPHCLWLGSSFSCYICHQLWVVGYTLVCMVSWTSKIPHLTQVHLEVTKSPFSSLHRDCWSLLSFSCSLSVHRVSVVVSSACHISKRSICF